MTHQTVSYACLEGNEKVIAAIRDIHEWCSAQQWNAIVDSFESPSVSTYMILKSLMMLVGITGYPLRALIETFRPEDLAILEEAEEALS